jgi:hypothetical protein
MSSQGEDNSSIARTLKVPIDMVWMLLKRWAGLQPIDHLAIHIYVLI